MIDQRLPSHRSASDRARLTRDSPTARQALVELHDTALSSVSSNLLLLPPRNATVVQQHGGDRECTDAIEAGVV